MQIGLKNYLKSVPAGDNKIIAIKMLKKPKLMFLFESQNGKRMNGSEINF